MYAQYFLSIQSIIDEMTYDVPNVKHHNAQLVKFSLRQILDVLSPTNFILTNPLVIKAMNQDLGMNFVNGYLNYIEDVNSKLLKQAPAGTENFIIGKNLAITPGKVIYKNELIELIQYTATTATVSKEPILIVPACIMKYYILDLSPYNSMVKYLVDTGHTVFMISWRNPDESQRDLNLSDYVKLGVIEALIKVNEIVNGDPIKLVGYCLGGTLLMIAMTLLAKTNLKTYQTVKSISLFASQLDFKDAGEILLFIDKDQLLFLNKIMNLQGYLSGSQMASAFNMLHAKDLIWSRFVQDYLLGTRYPLHDMMAWNADATRLPYSVHSEYLEHLYLNNEFPKGELELDGVKLSLAEIDIPIFLVSTEKDHIAPWKSVYKIHHLVRSDITFVLTRGGHNSGIISEPGHKDRSYVMKSTTSLTRATNAESWKKSAQKHDGSWWCSWVDWLGKNGDKQIEARVIDKDQVICDAPGEYVLQRYYD